MMELPESLTAIVHVRFHYGKGNGNGEERCGTEPRRAELLSKIVEKVSTMSPELQKVFEEFTERVEEVNSQKEQGPD
jgi:hypothetical protein